MVEDKRTKIEVIVKRQLIYMPSESRLIAFQRDLRYADIPVA